MMLSSFIKLLVYLEQAGFIGVSYFATKFPDDIKKQILDEKIITLSRVDNSLRFKTAGVETEKIYEATEWKE